jgi:2-desacetyl-2-hydroxyethyl bacteriochlorophyllide A dehydrogenase
MMRALVFERPLSLVVEERPEPEPGPGEVRLRVGAVGICGSDLHGYTGETGRRTPGMVMGHEIGGVLEETGAVATVHPVLFCGACSYCLAGSTELCVERRVIGVTPTLQGGFADAVCVPERNVVEVPGAHVEHAALVEPLAVALHAVRRGGVREGDRVFVAGAGTIGLVCLLAARREGAGEVLVSEPSAHRRSLAESFGATVLDPTELDVAEAVREATGGGAERALDAVGVSATADATLRATADDGTVVFVGMGLPRIDLDLYAIVVSERRIVGTFCYSERDFLDAAEWVASGELDLDRLIERRVGFDEVAGVFHRLAVGEDEAVKALLLTAA